MSAFTVEAFIVRTKPPIVLARDTVGQLEIRRAGRCHTVTHLGTIAIVHRRPADESPGAQRVGTDATHAYVFGTRKTVVPTGGAVRAERIGGAARRSTVTRFHRVTPIRRPAADDTGRTQEVLTTPESTDVGRTPQPIVAAGCSLRRRATIVGLIAEIDTYTAVGTGIPRMNTLPSQARVRAVAEYLVITRAGMINVGAPLPRGTEIVRTRVAVVTRKRLTGCADRRLAHLNAVTGIAIFTRRIVGEFSPWYARARSLRTDLLAAARIAVSTLRIPMAQRGKTTHRSVRIRGLTRGRRRDENTDR